MPERQEELSLEARLTRARRPPRPTPFGRRPRTGRYRSRPDARGRGVFLPPRGWRHRSTVKASYARNRRGASWAAHGAYLAREGAQREGGKGRGFDAERSDVDLAATLREWQRAGDVRLWKFIVSPEHGARLDLPAHTRALVAQIERDLGTRLEWAAIDHHNTGHPHVHLLVRGRDGEGRPLEIAPTYIKSGLRARSEELATDALGFRSEREHLAARGLAVERMQITEIDRALLRRAGPHGLVTYEGPRPRSRNGLETRLQELRRLQFLVGLGLAEKVGTQTWQLLPGMESALRQAQLAGDIIKSRARHVAQLSDPRMPLVVTMITAGTRVTGQVVGTGLADELRDRRYILLEGTDGRLHYIAQPPAIERARGAGRLRVGDVITLTGHGVERESRQLEIRIEVQPTPPGSTGRATGRPVRTPESAALPPLNAMERTLGRPAPIRRPVEGLTYRGRLIGYARGDDGQHYAVVDMGRELAAFRTETEELPAGRAVRVTADRTENDRHRGLRWRLGDAERERQRERA